MRGMAPKRTKWLLAAAMLALPASAFAQGPNYDVKTMNFDLWCQEQQHLDPDRCDKRMPGDEKDFETYRAKIEQYEIPYLQEKSKDVALDRNILNKDPVDNPISQDSQTQSLQQQRSPTIDPRTPKP
jgi:hypothetical protein